MDIKKHEIIFSACLILIATFISFYPSIQNDFVNWDDNLYVTENLATTELSWKNIKTIFIRFHMGHYHPLTLLSYALEYHFFKLDPFVYHTTNLILHLFNSLLVFWLIFMLKGGIFASLFVALLFGIHPLHVESVAWISERKDVLYSFFFLGSMLCYLYGFKNQRVKSYYLSLLLFILSLLSKGMAVSLPLVLILCDYLLDRKFDRKTWTEKIPFFLISLFGGVIGVFAQRYTEMVSRKTPLSFYSDILIVSDVLVSYLGKIMMPIKLSCIYPSIENIISPWPYVLDWTTIMGISIAVILLNETPWPEGQGFSWATRLRRITYASLRAPFIPRLKSLGFSGSFYKYTKKIAFGALFFLITILPVLPLKIVTDRYTYIPSIGLFCIAWEGFHWVSQWIKGHSILIKTFFLIIFIGIIGTFSFLTYERCQVWKDSLTLWNDVLKNYPNTPVAYNNRGMVYFEKGDFDRAIADYNRGLSINPNYKKAYYIYNNRGTAYIHKRDFDKAISDFTEAIEENPRYALAYNNRGNAYFEEGQYGKAFNDFNKAIEINPTYAEAYYNRGNTHMKMLQFERAILDYTKAIEVNPRLVEVYFNKALVCDRMGRLPEAIEAYKGFIKYAPAKYAPQIERARKRIRELSR